MPTAAPSTAAMLVEAARELVSAKGHNVTVQEIASRAGLAKPTFYAHFASKEALTRTMLEETVDRFFADLSAELSGRTEPIERVLAPFDLVFAGLPDPDYRGCVCLNAAASFPTPEHMSHAVLNAHDERLTRLFHDLLHEAGADEPTKLARQLTVLFDGVKARGLVDRTEQPGRDARDAADALIRAALRTPDALSSSS